MTALLTENGMRERVLQAVYDAGSQRAFARMVGLSESTLSKVLNGRRCVGAKLAAHLGFTTTVRYEPARAGAGAGEAAGGRYGLGS